LNRLYRGSTEAIGVAKEALRRTKEAIGVAKEALGVAKEDQRGLQRL
jgi:hypothetical protein